MRNSLRFKVALFFSVLTVVLLILQALGVKALAEAQEEKLITALIRDDMTNVLRSDRANPSLLPPFDTRLDGYVSGPDKGSIALPPTVSRLPNGTHEIIIGGQEIHVAIAPFGAKRLYRIYDFNVYEKHFKAVIDALMAGTGIFALIATWLSFGLSGLLVRQVAGFARHVKDLRLGEAAPIQPGKYDEAELVGLVEAFNEYNGRMADMIAREKEFTGNVSHELRTPLTAIRTSCELLEQDAAIVGKSRLRLQQIERAANNMRELADALLMLAREDSARDVESVKLADAVETALRPFEDALAAKGLEVVNDLERNCHVRANPSALAIVLSNLIDNAARHTEQGRLSFRYAQGRLRIEDTGAGISADALPHVFDRYYQAQSGSHSTSGVGIGLSIVKKICDRYRWSIQIESEPGKGTSVLLFLPPDTPAIPDSLERPGSRPAGS